METALSAEIEHDYLPEFNRMLPLPEGDDKRWDDEDRKIARYVRIQLWRAGPADGPKLRAAVEAAVAEAIEHGEIAEDDRTLRIDRVVELLSGDASIADPPDADEVALELDRCRERFAKFHRPWHEVDGGPMPPVPFPDRFGNWPGVRWREAVEHTLGKVCCRQDWASIDCGPRRPVPPTTSTRLAWLWLRLEKMEAAAGVADREAEGRRMAVEAALAALPVVFEDDRQTVLRFLVRFHATGEIEVPVSGDPLAEAKLLAELNGYDVIGLSADHLADVAEELIRFVASRQAATRESRVVPAVGYAIVVDGHGTAVDVAPGSLRLTIEGGRHVLRSPRWSRPVSLSSRDFRDWRRCAQAIYDQAGVEVDFPRGHWKRWWPSLAAQLLKSVEVVEDAQRQLTWEGWVHRLAEAAPTLSHAPTDGSAYRSTSGGFFACKGWIVAQAVEAGLIGKADVGTFERWLGKADKNRRDAHGIQRKVLALPTLLLGPLHERDQKIEVAGSSGADVAEKQG